jgi:hypothetical protein
MAAQWLRSATARLLRLWVRILPGHEYLLWLLCVVRQRFLPRPIPRPGESYRMWCVELSVMAQLRYWGGLDPLGLLSHGEKNYNHRKVLSSITPTYFPRSVCSGGASIPKYRRLVRIYEMEFVWWNYLCIMVDNSLCRTCHVHSLGVGFLCMWSPHIISLCTEQRSRHTEMSRQVSTQ